MIEAQRQAMNVKVGDYLRVFVKGSRINERNYGPVVQIKRNDDLGIIEFQVVIDYKIRDYLVSNTDRLLVGVASNNDW